MSIMADVNPLIPIITLNVNQLNNSIKSQSVNNISIQLENNKRFIFRYYQTGNKKYDKDIFTYIYMNLHCILGYINIYYISRRSISPDISGRTRRGSLGPIRTWPSRVGMQPAAHPVPHFLHRGRQAPCSREHPASHGKAVLQDVLGTTLSPDSCCDGTRRRLWTPSESLCGQYFWKRAASRGLTPPPSRSGRPPPSRHLPPGRPPLPALRLSWGQASPPRCSHPGCPSWEGLANGGDRSYLHCCGFFLREAKTKINSFPWPSKHLFCEITVPATKC